MPAKLRGGQAQGSPQKDPWSVVSWGLDSSHYDSTTYYPPSCHELSYFSGSPLRFDRGGELAKWEPGSYAVQTKVDLLGSSQGHRIYQVLQDIHSRIAKPEAGEEESGDLHGWQKIGMKRLLVERRPKEFCMIFEEEGRLGPLAEIVRIEPAKFVNMGEHVLLTYDTTPGNGGYTIDGAWIFDQGVPVSLLSSAGMLDEAINQALKETLPQGCQVKKNRNVLDLENFRVLAAVEPIDESADRAYCEGAVRLALGIKNHRFVVEDKQYTPQ